MNFTEAQTRLVQRAVDHAPAGWVQLYLDIEVEFIDGDFTILKGARAVISKAGNVMDEEFMIGASVLPEVRDLYKIMKKDEAEPFIGFELTIEADGRYKINFWHDPALRQDAARTAKLNNYLDYYRQAQQ